MGVGDLPDGSTKGSYYIVLHGLLFDMRSTVPVDTPEELAADNEQVIATYRPARYADSLGPFRAWERTTLASYSLVYYDIGHEFQIAGDTVKDKDPGRAAGYYAAAREWYVRALG